MERTEQKLGLAQAFLRGFDDKFLVRFRDGALSEINRISVEATRRTLSTEKLEKFHRYINFRYGVNRELERRGLPGFEGESFKVEKAEPDKHPSLEELIEVFRPEIGRVSK